MSVMRADASEWSDKIRAAGDAVEEASYSLAAKRLELQRTLNDACKAVGMPLSETSFCPRCESIHVRGTPCACKP